MITVKVPYTTSEESALQIYHLQRKSASVVRFSYCRSIENVKEIDIRKMVNALSNVSMPNCWLTQCAIAEGINFRSRNVVTDKTKKKGDEGYQTDRKVIFGKRVNFYKRLKNQITREEFKENRLMSLKIQGEARQSGNRLFNFSQLHENKLIFKVNRTNHIELMLPKMNKNYRKKLKFIQDGVIAKNLSVSVSLNDRYVFISYEEIDKVKQFEQSVNNKFIQNRYLGIDLNPNFIGVSVRERIGNEDVILHTEMFNLTMLTNPITSETNSSDSKRFKYLNNKLKNETILVAKQIERLLLKYKCRFCFIEDLKDISKANLGKGHYLNRLTKNLWKRDYFVENLIKRCQLIGCKLFKVNPMYTSVIGNLQHNFVDPVNASLEVGRRGYNVIILKNKQFYPEFRLNDLWKKQLSALESWKKVFAEVKNSKLGYRISLEECKLKFKVFKMDSVKSKVLICKFLIEKSGQELQVSTCVTV